MLPYHLKVMFKKKSPEMDPPGYADRYWGERKMRLVHRTLLAIVICTVGSVVFIFIVIGVGAYRLFNR